MDRPRFLGLSELPRGDKADTGGNGIRPGEDWGLSGADAGADAVRVQLSVKDGRITLQSLRVGLLPFAAALIAFVEATREDVEVKNYLCPPNRQPDAPLTLRGRMS